MNKLSRKILLIVLAACLHLTVNSAGSLESDPFPTIVLPIYQGGYEIEKSFNRMRGTKGLVYKVQTNYPAAEVLEFYDAENLIAYLRTRDDEKKAIKLAGEIQKIESKSAQRVAARALRELTGPEVNILGYPRGQ